MTSGDSAEPTGRRTPGPPSLDRVLTVVAVVAWLALVATAGESLADVLEERSGPVRVVASVGLWAGWTLVLGCLLVPRSVTLTAARIVAPVSVPLGVWALAAGSVGWESVAGASLAVGSTLLILSAPLGDRFVNGSAYGHERRFALRPPLAVLLGPLPLVWLVAVVGFCAGPLLAAAGQWVAGGVALVVGWPLAWLALRRAHMLSRRWLVFVPAGVVVHDPMVLATSVLAQRRDIAGIGPVEPGTAGMDLTMGAGGLVLAIRLRKPAEVLTNRARREAGGSYTAPGQETELLCMAPSRPGLVLAEAQRRRLPVG